MNHPRYSFAMCTVAEDDGKQYLYVSGGQDSANQIQNSVERYDPQTNIWTEIPSMSAPRVCHGLAAVRDSADGKLYLYAVGGYNDIDGRLKSVDRYDFETKVWSNVTDMTVARNCPAVGVVTKADGTDTLYVFGGMLESSTRSTSVEMLHTDGQLYQMNPEWSIVDRMEMTTPRGDFGVAIVTVE